MNQNQAQGEPCPSPANYQMAGPYQTQPPGHNLMKDRQGYPGKVPRQGETMSRGDGFWRGCFAGLCCYCCLDICF